jgi:hypothetical protein
MRRVPPETGWPVAAVVVVAGAVVVVVLVPPQLVTNKLDKRTRMRVMKTNFLIALYPFKIKYFLRKCRMEISLTLTSFH